MNDKYIITFEPPSEPPTPVKPEFPAEVKTESVRSAHLSDEGSGASSEDEDDNPMGYILCFETSDTIEDEDFERCFRLIESTCAATYKASSTGWSAAKKRKEMRLLDMKYLLLKSRRYDGEPKSLKGFLSFMLTIEDDHEVIYIYEIHLGKELQGKGVGKWMMGHLEGIGRRAGMEKAMLTVFRSNEGAAQFYEGLGYGVDEFSPGPRKLRGGRVKEADYLIMSKALGKGDEENGKKDGDEDEGKETEDDEDGVKMEEDDEGGQKMESDEDKVKKEEDEEDGEEDRVEMDTDEAKVKMEEDEDQETGSDKGKVKKQEDEDDDHKIKLEEA